MYIKLGEFSENFNESCNHWNLLLFIYLNSSFSVIGHSASLKVGAGQDFLFKNVR